MVNFIHSTLLSLLLRLAHCHTVITYPGWRGDNLAANGSIDDTNGLGTGRSGAQDIYPYGMQWIYPCGGMPITSNRTQWPVRGGAIAFQPGWFTGHEHALIYVNIGFGSVPINYSTPLLSPFAITGPSNNPYPGTVCLPQVPIPDGHGVTVGGNATIQIVEAAVHGAGMYSCVDITFVEDVDGDHQVNQTNCFNSTSIQFDKNNDSQNATVSGTRTGLFCSSATATTTAAVTALSSQTPAVAATVTSSGVRRANAFGTVVLALRNLALM